MTLKYLRITALILFCTALGGCDLVVLDPAGDVAAQQRNLLVESTGLMLLIILPVMALTAFFAWRYRASNTAARYEPDWDHSTQLELVIWGAPLLIIICLGAMTWMGTHLLDPYRSVDRIAAGRPIPANIKPLEVDVVALDWKWLFIYPEYGVATVNALASPVDRPIDFRITSATVMNSFYIPTLAGQIYAMPGMETKLHAVIDEPGTFDGFSANYSGAGFSGMRFRFDAMRSADFNAWVASTKAAGGALTREAYHALEQPSQNEPVRIYGRVDTDLYRAIVNMCVDPGKMCMNDMMAIDARGGLGLAGAANVLPLEYDKYARRGAVAAVFGPAPTYVASLCTPADLMGGMTTETPAAPAPVSRAPVLGAGLRPPFATSAPRAVALRPSQS